ncbi:MAG: ribonuclease HII [Bdellovibrionota bacterium]
MAQKPNLKEEALLWGETQSGVFVFGVDEAGRGCLAGPVCAAVACWKPLKKIPVPVRDSKQMSEPEREACFEPVRAQALAHGVGLGSREEIDRWNILRANHLAVARALEQALRGLGEIPLQARIVFLSDGGRPLVSKGRFFVESEEYAPEFPLTGALFRRGFEEKCIVKGDSKVFSIASASVLAKVSRDRLMVELDKLYPAYEFAAHKGYSTPKHVANLRKHGPCSEHRRSFAPVSDTLAALGLA